MGIPWFDGGLEFLRPEPGATNSGGCLAAVTLSVVYLCSGGTGEVGADPGVRAKYPAEGGYQHFCLRQGDHGMDMEETCLAAPLHLHDNLLEVFDTGEGCDAFVQVCCGIGVGWGAMGADLPVSGLPASIGETKIHLHGCMDSVHGDQIICMDACMGDLWEEWGEESGGKGIGLEGGVGVLGKRGLHGLHGRCMGDGGVGVLGKSQDGGEEGFSRKSRVGRGRARRAVVRNTRDVGCMHGLHAWVLFWAFAWVCPRAAVGEMHG